VDAGEGAGRRLQGLRAGRGRGGGAAQEASGAHGGRRGLRDDHKDGPEGGRGQVQEPEPAGSAVDWWGRVGCAAVCHCAL